MSALLDDLMSEGAPASSPAPMPSSFAGSGSARMPPSSSGAIPPSDPFPGQDREDIPAENIRRQVFNAAGIPKVTDAAGELVRENFEQFLEEFVSDSDDLSDHNGRYYISLIHGLKTYEISTLYVDFEHLSNFGREGLTEAITTQYYRFLPYLQRGLRRLIKKYEPELLLHAGTTSSAEENSSQPYTSTGGTSTTSTEESERIFQIAFYNLPKVDRIRELRTDKVGQLISISGTVTRTSEVRPELFKATFTCDACRAVVEGVEQVFRYTEPYMCPNATCQNRTSWSLNVSKSQFVDWQRVRIQENSNEIPTGSMPRTYVKLPLYI